jgi:hypothetical protein
MLFSGARCSRASVRPLNVGIVWIFMALFYGIGYVIAARRYR